jgi:hypothetical protein
MTRSILLLLITIVFVLFYRGNNPYDKASDLLSNANTVGNVINAYDSLLKNTDLGFDAFNQAYIAYQSLVSRNKLLNDSLLTIVDYSKPSNKERLYIFDLKNFELVDKSLVAHGQNSGIISPEEFSNRKKSHKSSLGLFITSVTYYGKHGYSLRIDGLEKGINDNARARAIVFHGAHYVSQLYIKKNGRLGRSFGCPAIPYSKTQSIIDRIKNGSCVYIYHPSILQRAKESNLTLHEN